MPYLGIRRSRAVFLVVHLSSLFGGTDERGEMNFSVGGWGYV